MENQEKVWDNIAQEWDKFKTIPSQETISFLEQTHGNVLDLGSGSGRHLMKINNGKMYLVDFSQEMLDLAEEKAKKQNISAEFIKSDLTKLPFKDNFFDFAICISSLHCIKGEENRKKTVQELYRVLKPKARAEIGVWNKNSKRFQKSSKEKLVKWRNKGERYYYLYEEKEIHNLFISIGFKIISTNNSNLMINFIVEKSQN